MSTKHKIKGVMLIALVALASACDIQPDYTGLESVDPNGYFLTTGPASDFFASPSLGGLTLAQVGALSLLPFETPIQFYFTVYHDTGNFNLQSAYQEVALDEFGGLIEDVPGKICRPETPEELALFNKHFNTASLLYFLYAIYHIDTSLYEEKPFIIPGFIGDYNLGAEWATILNPAFDGCAPENVATPAGFAKCHVLKAEKYALASSIGWNAKGEVNCEYNCRPFEDFSFTDSQGNTYEKFSGARNPLQVGKLLENNPNTNSWVPLVEGDGNGFLFHQAHVTPHIGFTAKLFGMGNREEQCQYLRDHEVDLPNYNYREEAEFVFEATRLMAESDELKARVEKYNSKLTSLLYQASYWGIFNSFDFTTAITVEEQFKFRTLTAGLGLALYNGVVLVWREKVRTNLVRPTTVADQLGDELIESYAGPYLGVKQMKASDWEPYVRTMPHAEYPSGSACLCTIFEEYMTLFSGSETISPYGSADMVQAAGSSQMEPGFAPSEDIRLHYDTWAEINYECGKSRTDGGMHFSKSVEVGNELCSGLAQISFDNIVKLTAGDSSGAFHDDAEEEILICEE